MSVGTLGVVRTCVLDSVSISRFIFKLFSLYILMAWCLSWVPQHHPQAWCDLRCHPQTFASDNLDRFGPVPARSPEPLPSTCAIITGWEQLFARFYCLLGWKGRRERLDFIFKLYRTSHSRPKRRSAGRS